MMRLRITLARRNGKLPGWTIRRARSSYIWGLEYGRGGGNTTWSDGVLAACHGVRSAQAAHHHHHCISSKADKVHFIFLHARLHARRHPVCAITKSDLPAALVQTDSHGGAPWVAKHVLVDGQLPVHNSNELGKIDRVGDGAGLTAVVAGGVLSQVCV